MPGFVLKHKSIAKKAALASSRSGGESADRSHPAPPGALARLVESFNEIRMAGQGPAADAGVRPTKACGISHVKMRHEGPPVHTITVPKQKSLKTGMLAWSPLRSYFSCTRRGCTGPSS